MFQYEKRLQFPVKICKPDAKSAQIIISQFGGPDGELAASMRYFSQKFATPYRDVAGLLNDIATEETVHSCWILHSVAPVQLSFLQQSCL